MRPLKLTRAGLLGTLAVFVIAAICVRLGFWQLDRRARKLERNAAVAERLADPAVVLRTAPADTTGLPYRPAEVVGRFDNDRAIVLAGRSHAGAPGVHLLTPLRLGGGAILVNRGWLPAPDAATADIGAVALDGEVRVEGVLMPFPEIRLDREPEADFRRTWFRFDGDAIRAQYRYPVSPVYLLATSRPAPTGAADPALPVVLEPPALDPGPHLSYAVQWFAFATIAVVGWAVVLARRSDEPSDPES
jgi:surfeit locus 1 family protein